MSDKYPSLVCPKCDVVIGIIKNEKLYRGSDPVWNNYCPFCLKNLTRAISEVITNLKNNKK